MGAGQPGEADWVHESWAGWEEHWTVIGWVQPQRSGDQLRGLRVAKTRLVPLCAPGPVGWKSIPSRPGMPGGILCLEEAEWSGSPYWHCCALNLDMARWRKRNARKYHHISQLLEPQTVSLLPQPCSLHWAVVGVRKNRCMMRRLCL